MKRISTFSDYLSEAVDKELNIKLWNAFTNLVDGLDGIISEEGELSDRFWKEDVEKRMESFNEFWGKDKIEMKKLDGSKLKTLIEDMLDGLDGWESEGHSVSKYFKSTKVISDAKKTVGFVNESFASKFYTDNKNLHNDFRDAPFADLNIKDENVKTERYDILAKDLLTEFDVKISSKYFAFLVNLDNKKITDAWGANSGANLKDFKKTTVGQKYTAEEFYKMIKDKKVPVYIRESNEIQNKNPK